MEDSREKTVLSISANSEVNVVPCTLCQYVDQMNVNLFQQHVKYSHTLGTEVNKSNLSNSHPCTIHREQIYFRPSRDTSSYHQQTYKYCTHGNILQCAVTTKNVHVTLQFVRGLYIL